MNGRSTLARIARLSAAFVCSNLARAVIGGAGFAAVGVMTFPPQAGINKRTKMMGESFNICVICG